MVSDKSTIFDYEKFQFRSILIWTEIFPTLENFSTRGNEKRGVISHCHDRNKTGFSGSSLTSSVHYTVRQRFSDQLIRLFWHKRAQWHRNFEIFIKNCEKLNPKVVWESLYDFKQILLYFSYTSSTTKTFFKIFSNPLTLILKFLKVYPSGRLFKRSNKNGVSKKPQRRTIHVHQIEVSDEIVEHQSKLWYFFFTDYVKTCLMNSRRKSD